MLTSLYGGNYGLLHLLTLSHALQIFNKKHILILKSRKNSFLKCNNISENKLFGECLLIIIFTLTSCGNECQILIMIKPNKMYAPSLQIINVRGDFLNLPEFLSLFLWALNLYFQNWYFKHKILTDIFTCN